MRVKCPAQEHNTMSLLKPEPLNLKTRKVVQYTRSVMGRQTGGGFGDGSQLLVTVCHFATCWQSSIILCTCMNVCGIIILEQLRNIVTLLLPVYLSCLPVVATHHEPSSLLTTRYGSGVLDMYGDKCTNNEPTAPPM